MDTRIEKDAPRTLAEADLKPRGTKGPGSSPLSWRDEVVYFLLPDRFSDGQEASEKRKIYVPGRKGQTPVNYWCLEGKKFQGGTLRGIASKLDYLHDLGVTALWVGPVWKQRADADTYHGYAVQNFLEIDPRFGTRQDLRHLVDEAHRRGMYVILDVVLNHTGNNWSYDIDGQPGDTAPYLTGGRHKFCGWRANGSGLPIQKPFGLEDGVWPEEFQNPDWYMRAGQIDNFNSQDQCLRGDLWELKRLDTDRDDVMTALVKVYQYWIALSDCDGFRIDALRHISIGASRKFCWDIREYAESIGKENFFLLGEVAGNPPLIKNYLKIYGYNIDAFLDIGDPPDHLARMVKGLGYPCTFFDQFRRKPAPDLGIYRQTGRYHVSILDDHDMLGRSGRNKARFSGNDSIKTSYEQVAHAVGVQLTTPGIPCIYYGSEQAFDGNQSYGCGEKDYLDRFIRETMFGGRFGAFRTSGCHFFNGNHPTYLRIAAIARLRNASNGVGPALRRGRLYPRDILFQGGPFGQSWAGQLVAWSRIHHDREVLIIINTNGNQASSAAIEVDPAFHGPGSSMEILYQGDWTNAELKSPPQGLSVPVSAQQNRPCVDVNIPPAGMMILA